MKVRMNLDGLDAVKQRLGEISDRDLRYAGVQASNTLAFGVRGEWQRTARRVFDRPVKLTIDAAQYRKATLARPEAEVKLRDEAFKGTPPVKYLLAEVQGGPRRRTRFEQSLAAAGILPQGMFAVPAQGVKLDAFGNMPRGLHTRILSALRASRDEGQNRTRPQARQRARSQRGRTAYFAIRQTTNGLPPGIYERLQINFGSGATSVARMIFAFVRQPSYRARYSVFQVAEDYIARSGTDVLARELERAVAATRARQGGEP